MLVFQCSTKRLAAEQIVAQDGDASPGVEVTPLFDPTCWLLVSHNPAFRAHPVEQ